MQVDYIPKLGTISEIWSVNHKETGEIRAAKIIKKALKSTSTATEMFKSEAKTLKQLTHPNVLKIIEVFEDDNNYYMVTELLEGNNLNDYLASISRKSLNEKIIANFLRQLLSGVNYCPSVVLINII